jgi:hypothetical protein
LVRKSTGLGKRCWFRVRWEGVFTTALKCSDRAASLRRILDAQLCGWLGESRSFVRSIPSCGCGDLRWRGRVVNGAASCWLRGRGSRLDTPWERGRGLPPTSHLHQHLSFPSFSDFFLPHSLSLTLRNHPHPPPPSTYLFFTREHSKNDAKPRNPHSLVCKCLGSRRLSTQ